MRYITYNYIPNLFKINDKNVNDVIIIQEINQLKFFTTLYHPLVTNMILDQIESDIFNQFKEYIKKNKILVYHNISNYFLDSYIMIYDNAKIFNNKKNILIFDMDVTIAESILYYNTITSNFGSTTYYIESHTSSYDFDILKMNYSGDLIMVNIESSNLIENYQDKKIDMIFCNIKDISIILSILDTGGSFIFYNDILSPSYLKSMLYILAKYFKTIGIYKTKFMNKDYFICETFIGWNAVDDIELLKKSTNITYQENDIIENYVKEYYIYNTLQAKKNIKHLSTIHSLTLDNLILYYNNAIKQDYYNVVNITKQYKLALSESYLKNHSLVIDSISNLFMYKPIQYCGINIFDPNHVIKIGSNIVSLEKLNNIFIYLNVHKIGIDSRKKAKWEKLTYDTNISNYLIKYIKQTHNIIVSRAFIKMHELLTTFPIISNVDKIMTLHICEAPGHFINAVSHFIKSKYPNIQHTWLANSLNPYSKINQKKYGNILSDKYGYIKKYPKKWLWGDGTGDITLEVNIRYFKTNYANKIDFITSDCGLETNTRIGYFTQEHTMSKTNFSQIFIALLVLQIGGSGIFKFFFPFSKPLTISLIYLLTLFFEQVYISKPNTSSATNNEIYFIAIHKKYDLTEDKFNVLIKFLNNFDNKVYLFDTFDETFMSQLENITYSYVNNQINELNTIYQLYDNNMYHEKKDQIIEAQKKFSVNWTFCNKFTNINDNDFL